jgi:hypothetical protein
LRTGDDPIRLRCPRDGGDHLVVLRENHQHNTLHDGRCKRTSDNV